MKKLMQEANNKFFATLLNLYNNCDGGLYSREMQAFKQALVVYYIMALTSIMTNF